MKKIFLSIVIAAAFCSFTLNVSAQQGKWKGTIKYKLTYEGAVSPQMPQEFEVKVYENKTKYIDMFQYATVISNATAKNLTFMWDFSQIPVEGVQGKWYMKKKMDDLIAKCTYEFTGKTKTLAGKNVKEVNVTFQTDEGEEKETIWACDEIGPVMDVSSYPGLKAVPFEYTVEFKSQGIVIKYEAVEIKDGGVKETDVLMEVGYEEQSEEEIGEMFKMLMEAMGGGNSDEDI
ncbi:MAG: hypothetical protein LBR28_04365 [Bacteroidales bacterium]|jgi:hypothetical protein|nr:hypothetical protein [Bacteroidales bacterium]